MKTLMVKDLPDDIAEALDRERRRRGESLDETVIHLLGEGLGVGGARSNGLARLAGTWSNEEFNEFRQATEPFERVDDELWS